MTEVDRLLASGRDADIFEYGSGQVLRRSKHGRVIEPEARVMQYAADQGFPVPHVFDVRAGGTEIVMERLDGPMMMDVIAKRPNGIFRGAHLLADLHDRLHKIPGPDWLPELGDGRDSLLHLDLHPLNVIVTERGPVVIDWTNAARGNPLTDVGLTYVLLTCPNPPFPRVVRAAMRPFRMTMATSFVRRYRGPDLRAHTAAAARMKMLDPNMAPDEVDKCRRLAVRCEARLASFDSGVDQGGP